MKASIKKKIVFLSVITMLKHILYRILVVGLTSTLTNGSVLELFELLCKEDILYISIHSAVFWPNKAQA